ncbi:Thiamine pyrophosphate protein domain protein TPP-binding protein [Operophtera brumata]|uniref:Thiamine pyrophosphate protein domain protein TPP-binding protein n=1 Tax=Operophtera brumata TaxID=104452 RepID=A0A0L7LCD6_OPEBR|nr:Thiamine pyrophosphate protein domain protein TPP-binding protein [Operophtera brumata]
MAGLMVTRSHQAALCASVSYGRCIAPCPRSVAESWTLAPSSTTSTLKADGAI